MQKEHTGYMVVRDPSLEYGQYHGFISREAIGETGAFPSFSNSGGPWLIGNSSSMVVIIANSLFTKCVFLEQLATIGPLLNIRCF